MIQHSILYLIMLGAAIAAPASADYKTEASHVYAMENFPVNPLARYGLPEMAQLWSDEHRFDVYFKVEGYINEALAAAGLVDKGLPERYWKNGKFNVAKIREAEKETQHEFLAFLKVIGDTLGDDAKSVHYGITSSNILDTGFNVQLAESIDLIDKEIDSLIKALTKIATENKDVLCMGHTHGMHAEPLSFGVKMLRFVSEFKRAKERLAIAKKEISIASIAGAVGNFVNITPDIESYVATELGFEVEPVSSQVVPRDRYAMLFSVIGIIGSSLENLATEVRHLQRSEVGEVQEPFRAGKQKGSSAMPHKRNPIKCENLVGMARILRSLVMPSMENQTLWHERDMSHSSVERFTATESMILSHYALNMMAKIIDGLVIHKDRMQKNIDESKYVFFSQQLMLRLVDKGMQRDKAYRTIQKTAHAALDSGKDFRDEVKSVKEITDKLSPQDLDKIFDLAYYRQNVNVIFKRVLG